jgi:hypothetical protein
MTDDEIEVQILEVFETQLRTSPVRNGEYPYERREILCVKKCFMTMGVNYRQVNDTATERWKDE